MNNNLINFLWYKGWLAVISHCNKHMIERMFFNYSGLDIAGLCLHCISDYSKLFHCGPTHCF